MLKLSPYFVPALIIATVIGCTWAGLLSPAELRAVEAEPRGLDISQIYAMAPSNLPAYEDRYQHYGILDPVRP